MGTAYSTHTEGAGGGGGGGGYTKHVGGARFVALCRGGARVRVVAHSPHTAGSGIIAYSLHAVGRGVVAHSWHRAARRGASWHTRGGGS